MYTYIQTPIEANDHKDVIAAAAAAKKMLMETRLVNYVLGAVRILRYHWRGEGVSQNIMFTT